MRIAIRLELPVALALLVVSDGALAQLAPPEGCFCLRHVATDQFLRACSGFRPSGSFYGRAFCTDSETGEDNDVLVTEAWKIVPDGADGCAPCEPESRTTREVPRKPTDEQEEASE